MRAAQAVAPRQWEIVETEKPRATAHGMLVRVERVAVCGTDRPYHFGVVPSYPQPPGTPGHEGLGVVEDCPSGEHQPGERVLLYGCDRGMFQEYVLASPAGCIPLPRDIDPEVMLMSQLLGTVLHCFYKLGNVIGQRAVVVGQGPVGLLFDAVLRNLGAGPIIGVDPMRHRRELGQIMGATHTVDPHHQDPVATVARLTDGEMADVVVEAVGVEPTYNLCSRLARHRGTVIFFGVPNKENLEHTITLDLGVMFEREIRLVNSVGPEPLRDYTVARDWIVQERLDVRPVVSHVLPLAQIQQAFTMAFDEPERHGAAKVLLRMD
jgi:threonine dehydrogenase-like Zn-dependent dehydrogenase